MIKDEGLTERYYDFREENDRLNQSIINEVQRKSFKQGYILGYTLYNMYQNDVSLDLISKYTGLTIEKIEEIIKKYHLKK